LTKFFQDIVDKTEQQIDPDLIKEKNKDLVRKIGNVRIED
jgi:hypothetical protein